MRKSEYFEILHEMRVNDCAERTRRRFASAHERWQCDPKGGELFLDKTKARETLPEV